MTTHIRVLSSNKRHRSRTISPLDLAGSGDVNTCQILSDCVPLLRSMQLAGLFHRVTEQLEGATFSSPLIMDKKDLRARKSGICQILNTVYHLFVLGLLWLNVLKICLSFKLAFWTEFVPYLLNTRIVMVVWLAFCACNSSIFFYACRGDGANFLRCIKEIEFLRREMCDRVKNAPSCYIRRKIVIFTSLSWLFAFVNTALLCFGALSSMDPTHSLYKVLTNPFPPLPGYLTLFLIIHFYDACASVFPITVIGVISVVTKSAFKTLNVWVEQEVGEGKREGLEDIRRVHARLCELVADTDKEYRIFIAAICVTYVSLNCFLLYQMILVPMDTFFLCINVMWITTNFGYIGVTLITSALLNKEVHMT